MFFHHVLLVYQRVAARFHRLPRAPQQDSTVRDCETPEAQDRPVCFFFVVSWDLTMKNGEVGGALMVISYNVEHPSAAWWFINPINYSYKYHKP